MMVLSHNELRMSSPVADTSQKVKSKGSIDQNLGLFQWVIVQYQKKGDSIGRETMKHQKATCSLMMYRALFDCSIRININRKLTKGVDNSVSKRQQTNHMAPEEERFM